MSLYCHTKNGEIIKGPQTLPENWENVSNFNLLPDDFLRRYGWLPYFKVTDNKEVIVSSIKEVFQDKVVETFITRNKTQEEIEQTNNEALQNRWNDIRNHRDELLKASDRYALIDVWNNMNSTKQEQWSIYRQQLRDVPQIFSHPDEVVFPEIPN